jgi:hypothetical protein
MSSGFPIQAWAFIPKTNLRGEGGESFHVDSGCLKQFESSPGVYRESCKTCGATVFWHSDERPDLIDVSVGLLRLPAVLARRRFWNGIEVESVSSKRLWIKDLQVLFRWVEVEKASTKAENPTGNMTRKQRRTCKRCCGQVNGVTLKHALTPGVQVSCLIPTDEGISEWHNDIKVQLGITHHSIAATRSA